MDPKYVRAYYFRAFIYLIMNQLDKAMEDCIVVMNDKPNDFPDVFYVR